MRLPCRLFEWFNGEYVSAVSLTSSEGDDLARIHDVLRVERLLERPHDGERLLAVLAREVFHLPLPDPVLTRAGALHGERALDQPLAQPVGTADLVPVVHVDQQ